MIVMFECSPTLCAARCTSSHWSELILSGQSIGANVVVENLGGGAGQRLQPGVLQPCEVRHEVLLGSTRTLEDLERAEGVDVDRGRARAHRGHHVDVVVAVELGMDATLETDLGGALGFGLAHPLADLVERQEVGVAAKVERQRTLREGAEAALEGADVGVVDVAIDHETDGVAHRGRDGRRRRRSTTALKSRTSRVEERRQLVAVEVVARLVAREERRDGTRAWPSTSAQVAA